MGNFELQTVAMLLLTDSNARQELDEYGLF